MKCKNYAHAKECLPDNDCEKATENHIRSRIIQPIRNALQNIASSTNGLYDHIQSMIGQSRMTSAGGQTKVATTSVPSSHCYVFCSYN